VGRVGKVGEEEKEVRSSNCWVVSIEVVVVVGGVVMVVVIDW